MREAFQFIEISMDNCMVRHVGYGTCKLFGLSGAISEKWEFEV